VFDAVLSAAAWAGVAVSWVAVAWPDAGGASGAAAAGAASASAGPPGGGADVAVRPSLSSASDQVNANCGIHFPTSFLTA
jgi:hypothetical protein